MSSISRWWPRVLLILVAVVVAFNALAWRHAHAMLHYVQGGPPPPRPESLSACQKVAVLFTGVRVPRPANTRTPAEAGLPFQVCTIPVDGATRLEAWYVPVAAPRALVVLFPGYQACKDTVLGEAAAYRALNCACLLVDFRGTGGSSGDTTTLGWREAADVSAAYRAARGLAGPQTPVVLHGFSMGAAAVLRAIAVDGIKPDGIVVEAVFDRMLTTIRNRFHLMHAPSFPAAELLLFWGGIDLGFNGFRNNPVAYAAQVTVPALVLAGSADPRATEAQVRHVADSLTGPKQMVVFNGVAHESLVAARPRRWEFVIDAFLTSRVHLTPPRETP